MADHTRPNGSTYFTDSPAVDPAIGAKIDEELNGITSVINALDNANIADTPKIAGSKIDLTTAGFMLPDGSVPMTATLVHDYDGIFRKMRAAGNGRVREYRGSDGAIWGISYNTEWVSGAWAGRDVTDICAALKMESDGLHYYHAVSGAAASAPSFTEVFHVNASGVFQVIDCVQTSNIQADSIPQSKINWANAGGLQQGLILETEITHTGDTNWTEVSADHVQIYIPSNATSLEYVARIKSSGGAVTTSCRLASGATNGTAVTTQSTSYAWSSAGTLNVSALSGWQSIDIDLMQSSGVDTAYVDRIAYRII